MDPGSLRTGVTNDVTSDGRASLAGQRLGPYQVEGPLGAGGMGVVYRARDTRLARDVAIKMLPRAFAADPERVSRFEREARVLASLNHPHIATIFGVEEIDGAPAIVMELIDGETLSERLSRLRRRGGTVPVDDALAIATQVAEALDAAHEKGIVHRDLKPGNIAFTRNGLVKVLDFGLAKIAANAVDDDAASTMTREHTVEGAIVGTAAYMSPEQARGQAVDKRTDIWAFGCVLYEMLTGRSAFGRETMSDTLASVLEREPDWSALPSRVPSHVAHVLRRCLEKDPRRRLRDIGDVLIDPADTIDQPAANTRQSGRAHIAWAIGALASALLAFWAGRAAAPREDHATVTRTTIVLPDDQRLVSTDFEYPLALSRDGTTLAYVGSHDGETQLFVRELSRLDARAIPDSSGAKQPFFSPDGAWLAFFSDGALQKVPVAGGPAQRIAKVTGVSMGATWGVGDTIVWATRGADLMRVSASGGVPQALRGSAPAFWPDILPDGKTVLFTTGGSAIAVMPVEGGAKRVIAKTADSPLDGPAVLGAGTGVAQARLLANGYLVYGQSENPGAVRAVPFDPKTLQATGQPISMVNSVERAANGGGVYFAVSDTLLLYATTRDRHQLVWVDRGGVETPISADRAAFRLAALSPNGERIAVAINDETRRSDIWLYDTQRGTKGRLTTEAHNLSPVWTPDGQRVSFSSAGRLVEMPADGAGRMNVLVDAPAMRRTLPPGTNGYPTGWSPDGTELLFHADNQQLWLYSRRAQPPIRPLLAGDFAVHSGQLSPDGQWLAYVSDESGRDEVYVRHYPDLTSPVPVSTSGSSFFRWSKDGREIFFRKGNAIFATAVQTKPRFVAGTAQRLFAGTYVGAGRDGRFDVSSDGKRFLMIKSDDAAALDRLAAVQNWAGELARASVGATH